MVKKKQRTEDKNKSKWRTYRDIQQGDQVIVRRAMRSGKFASIYEPEPYLVINQQGASYQLLRRPDNHITHCHINDLKPYHLLSDNKPSHYILSQRWQSSSKNQLPSSSTTMQRATPVPSCPASTSKTPSKIPRPHLQRTNRGLVTGTFSNRPKRQVKPPVRFTCD